MPFAVLAASSYLAIRNIGRALARHNLGGIIPVPYRTDHIRAPVAHSRAGSTEVILISALSFASLVAFSACVLVPLCFGFV